MKVNIKDDIFYYEIQEINDDRCVIMLLTFKVFFNDVGKIMSKCCKSEVILIENVVQYYLCISCGRPCDIYFDH